MSKTFNNKANAVAALAVQHPHLTWIQRHRPLKERLTRAPSGGGFSQMTILENSWASIQAAAPVQTLD